MRRGFTIIELLLAVMLLGVLTSLSVLTFNAVSRGWQASADYMDKMQRTDFALEQLYSALRSMHYPHAGKQDGSYGFMLTNGGDGEKPDDSDTIEWSKKGSALVGKSAVGDSDHRVQVRMYEEGDRFGKLTIEKTGLYARMCVNEALKPKDSDKEEDYFTFANEELYQPVLIADGIVGFNCRVLKNADKVEKENDEGLFEDEFAESNAVPYKVELTFRLEDPEGRGYRSNAAPVIRIIRIPIHEQSLDGAATPDKDGGKEDKKGGKRTTTGKKGTGGTLLPPPGGGAR